MIDSRSLSLEDCIAQKLMLDIRFFDDGRGRSAVRALSPALADGLAALKPCGVILFSENLVQAPQAAALCQSLQKTLAPAGPVALIGIDQEGGRVTRMPRDWSTGFSGNMALGACDPQRRDDLARRMAAAQGRELAALGVNVNFVPSVDVNSNPANPVIQVRSFGDDPAVVAALGAAVIEGAREAGLAVAAKHFPGHGDTSVDSHTGLPRVERDRHAALALDLAPFASVIRKTRPDMVMTAHIQYPCLDDSTVPGSDMMRPATLSRRIIEGVLRDELGFQGVVISDALDMRAISDRFSPAQAVLECFGAGVDIALMPLLLRCAEDFERLHDIVRQVADAVRAGTLQESLVRDSAQRILDLRQKLTNRAGAAADLACLASEAHLALEEEIAAASLTALNAAPPALRAGQSLHLLLPDAASESALCEALAETLPGVSLSSQNLEHFDPERERVLIASADACLVGIAEPSDSPVVLGGAEDLAREQARPALDVQLECLRLAHRVPRIAWLMRSPYPAADCAAVADSIVASYDSAPRGAGGRPGPAYRAVAAWLAGRLAPGGHLPVQVPGLAADAARAGPRPG